MENLPSTILDCHFKDRKRIVLCRSDQKQPLIGKNAEFMIRNLW